MNGMSQKMSEASDNPPVDEGVGRPKKGERFRCAKCSMELEVTADCGCEEPSKVHFHCCGQELQKV